MHFFISVHSYQLYNQLFLSSKQPKLFVKITQFFMDVYMFIVSCVIIVSLDWDREKLLPAAVMIFYSEQ